MSQHRLSLLAILSIARIRTRTPDTQSINLPNRKREEMSCSFSAIAQRRGHNTWLLSSMNINVYVECLYFYINVLPIAWQEHCIIAICNKLVSYFLKSYCYHSIMPFVLKWYGFISLDWKLFNYSMWNSGLIHPIHLFISIILVPATSSCSL